MIRGFVGYAFIVVASLRALLRTRREQAVVELTLRQQLAIYAQNQPRPRLTAADRGFWVALLRFWPRWRSILVIVRPETVVRWHRKGFRLYWRSLSKRGPGRPRIFPEVRELIRSDRVADWIEQLGIEPKATALRSPWQNGLAERWIGTVRRELLDHVVPVDEEHLRRLLFDSVEYYNSERVHTRLRSSPVGRTAEERPSSRAQVVGRPRLGGLHCRYAWNQAA